MIKRINKHSDFTRLALLLNEAFATVAKEFGLTKENSPTNNAFITGDALQLQLTENRELYCYEEKGKPIGFIAIEQSSKEPDTFYIEKMAVHPDYRHQGRTDVDGFCYKTDSGTRWETHFYWIDK